MFLTTKKYALALQEKIALHDQQFNEAASFIQMIEKGQLDVEVSHALAQTQLGRSLSSVKDHLKKLADQESKRNWLNVGLAKFSDILRNKNSLDFTELSNDILKNIVNYVSANQGAMFIVREEEDSGAYLELVACYAYSRRKYLAKKINAGEGLVGQCMLEKESIYLREVPDNYVTIGSGLGEARPRSIFISPLQINEKIFGVLELASFQDFDEVKREFINRLSENIAASIKNVRESDRILNLLNASQQQAEELRAQEEEMRQNVEEMQATQEEMQRKTNEVIRVSAEMTSILNGINAAMATIEFLPDGTILTANQIFLNTMKYSLTDIKGKHHRKFVPQDILTSSEYETFWKRLSRGEALTGVFRRMAADRSTIWLNAIYTPILDGNNKVIKVVKFASNVTNEQELVAETQGTLKGIDATMATIEFTPDGRVIKANQNFLKCMKYTLPEIQGKHHRMFLTKEHRESHDYTLFWKRLASGEPITGEFYRVASDGSGVSLKAMYNPIISADGKVVKVVKFAVELSSNREDSAQEITKDVTVVLHAQTP